MLQSTRSAVRRYREELRHDPQSLFAGLLDTRWVIEVLFKEHARWKDGGVYSPCLTLWTFLQQVLDPDHSCRAAVARLVALLAERGEKVCSAATGPYCKARQRLPLGVLSSLTRRIGRDLQDKAHQRWLFKGRDIEIIDGTTALMPDTAKNQQAFPQNPVQKPGLGFPIARLVAIISLATRAIREVAIGPYQGKQTGETALFRSLWDQLVTGQIILGDRCFASFFGIAPLLPRGVDGVFRMHQCRKIDFRRGRLLGVLDHVVNWLKPTRPDWMDQATYDQIPDELPLRELRFKVVQSGFRVAELVLVTTLLDATLHTKEEVAGLYLQRWQIELDLRSIKVEMRMEELRCKTPEMVEKEVWMHLLAYNVICSEMNSAAQASRASPRELSFRGAMQTIRAFDAGLRHCMGPRRAELIAARGCAIAEHRVGQRPGRCEPRAKKRRPKQQRLLMKPRDESRKALMGNK